MPLTMPEYQDEVIRLLKLILMHIEEILRRQRGDHFCVGPTHA